MMNNENNKFYVFGYGWQGATEQEIWNRIPSAGEDEVFDTYEEARARVDEMWDGELAPDEVCYLVLPNLEIEEY